MSRTKNWSSCTIPQMQKIRNGTEAAEEEGLQSVNFFPS